MDIIKEVENLVKENKSLRKKTEDQEKELQIARELLRAYEGMITRVNSFLGNEFKEIKKIREESASVR